MNKIYILYGKINLVAPAIVTEIGGGSNFAGSPHKTSVPKSERLTL